MPSKIVRLKFQYELNRNAKGKPQADHLLWRGNQDGSPTLILPRGEEIKNDSWVEQDGKFGIPICTKSLCKRAQIAMQFGLFWKAKGYLLKSR